MDRIIVTLKLTQEEIDRLIDILQMVRNDDDAEHLVARIYNQTVQP